MFILSVAVSKLAKLIEKKFLLIIATRAKIGTKLNKRKSFWIKIGMKSVPDHASWIRDVVLVTKVGIRNLSPHLRNSAILRTTKSSAELRTKKVAELRLRTFKI
jgi:hypothetical protein